MLTAIKQGVLALLLVKFETKDGTSVVFDISLVCEFGTEALPLLLLNMLTGGRIALGIMIA